MTAPAYAHVQRAETPDERRAAYWQARDGGREAEGDLMWSAYLHWQLLPGNNPTALSTFLAYMVEGREESTGGLYNGFDLGRARASGYTGPLTRLYLTGRALRGGMARSEIDASSTPELRERLRVQALSTVESNAAALAPLQERTRALLREADPSAPTAAPEADALNLSVLEVIPAPLYRAAVQAVQTGDLGALYDLAEATRPPEQGTWSKEHGRCWTCGRITPGAVLDLHHVRLGQHSARPNDDTPAILVSVHRACHVPVPFSERETAHDRAHAVLTFDQLEALTYYRERERLRYEAFIRGERDPAQETA